VRERKAASIALVVGLSGCDSLFNLEHVSPIDAAIDTSSPDVMPDADHCAVTEDEDSDGLTDPCDPCPTVGTADPADADTDGLPDVCDPNLGANMRDMIQYRAMLSSAEELDQFTRLGDTYIAGNHGQVMLTGGGRLMTLSSYAPTKIEVRVSGATGTANTALIRVGIGSLACEITGADCATNTNTQQVCARVKSGVTFGSGVTSNFPISAVTSVLLQRAAPTSSVVYCVPRAGGAGSQASLVAGIPQDMVFVEPGNQAIFVNSFVIYATQ
jgi:hypothetical protein